MGLGGSLGDAARGAVGSVRRAIRDPGGSLRDNKYTLGALGATVLSGGAASGASGLGVGMGGLSGAASTIQQSGVAGAQAGLLGANLNQQQRASQQQADLIAQQQATLRRQQQTRRGQIGAVRDLYGVVPAGRSDKDLKYRHLGIAMANRARIGGAIESQADALRDAGAEQLTGAAAGAATNDRAQLAARGLLGSSLEGAAKGVTLGTYLGGRAGLAGSVQGARQGAQEALSGQRLAMESKITRRGLGSALPALQAQRTAMQGAMQALPYTAFGSALGDQLENVGSFARIQAQQPIGRPKLAAGERPITTGAG